MKLLALLMFGLTMGFVEAKPSVTVTLAPYAYAVDHITEGLVDVQILIPEVSNPHIYESRPQDVKRLAKSDLWFCSGEHIEKKITTSIKAKKIDLNQNIELIGESCCTHHTHHDLHTWMSPENYRTQATLIYEALCKEFPEYRLEFKQNFTLLDKELLDLIGKVKSIQKGGFSKDLVVSHSAYRYLCRDLGIQEVSIEHEGKEASLKHIQNIFAQQKTTPPKKIFAEIQHGDSGAKRLAELLHVDIVLVNPYQRNYPLAVEEMMSQLQ